MHYRNGREAKNGDKVIQLQANGAVVVGAGILYDAVPGNNFCNGRIAPLPDQMACLADCLHIDDVKAMLVAYGYDTRLT